MTESSIARARKVRVAEPPAEQVDFSALPKRDGSLDTVFLLFAAHELRSATAREVFFAEISRILKPGGTVFLVEHLRDASNFFAFGPGFLHFLPGREWMRLFAHAGLVVSERFSITPFVAVFHLTKPACL